MRSLPLPEVAAAEPAEPAPVADARRRPGAKQRRAQIVREAARCFGTRGFHGTTTRDVARAVGITEAALYRYFSGKEAIYAAILDERIAAPDPIAELEAAARVGDDRAVFEGLATTLLHSVEADPSFLRLLLYSALEGHEMARPFQETRIRRLREFLSGYIAARARAGSFRAVDPALAARAFIGMVVDHLIVRQVFGQRDAYPQPPEEVARTFVSIFLEGVRTRTPGRRAVARPGAHRGEPGRKRLGRG
jgi:AcrR family transcriptional regulator